MIVDEVKLVEVYGADETVRLTNREGSVADVFIADSVAASWRESSCSYSSTIESGSELTDEEEDVSIVDSRD